MSDGSWNEFADSLDSPDELASPSTGYSDRANGADKCTDLHGSTPPPEELSPQQMLALAKLAAGGSFTAAAAAAQVHRNTICQWLKNDVNFLRAYRERRDELLVSADNLLLNLAGEAATAVSRALGCGNGHLGLQLLKQISALANNRLRYRNPDEAR